MKDLYTSACIECSTLITKRYSTSFSLGILMLDKSMRNDIYSIYGFVRLADEIVDTYQDKDPAAQLKLLREETGRAIRNGISFNPVLHAFQDTVNRNQIDSEYILAFLHSMEMDLSDQKYDRSLYEQYIYGSAEVVGLMCLRVFCKGDNELFHSLVKPARKLGSAFQKVNFLRDMRSDLVDRKRVYFPGLDISRFNRQDKQQIEKEIEEEFAEAQQGINRLPSGCRRGVQLALNYYRVLLRKIARKEANELLSQRIRVSNFHKFVLLARNLIFNSLIPVAHA
jgi:phytoene synthase